MDQTLEEKKRARMAYNKAHYQKNREAKLAYEKQRYLDSYPLRREKSLIQQADYRSRTKDLRAEKAKLRRLNESHEEKEKRRVYVRERYQNPVICCSRRIRSRLQEALVAKGFLKNGKTESIIGCDWDQFKLHIESQFSEGMNWDNRGEWHVDHRIPLAQAVTLNDVIRLSHFSNLQPLWKRDNLQKGKWH